MSALAYPVVFQEDAGSYLVTVPDIDRMTQGTDLANAIAMARDLISICLLEFEESGQAYPAPSAVEFEIPQGATLSYVDVDMVEYRRKYSNKAVKKNCTIPAWLNTRAEELEINFSQVLKEALIAKIEALD